MSPAEPLLILTDDDLLAERWQALGRSPVRARRVGDLDSLRFKHLKSSLTVKDLIL